MSVLLIFFFLVALSLVIGFTLWISISGTRSAVQQTRLTYKELCDKIKIVGQVSPAPLHGVEEIVPLTLRPDQPVLLVTDHITCETAKKDTAEDTWVLVHDECQCPGLQNRHLTIVIDKN